MAFRAPLVNNEFNFDFDMLAGQPEAANQVFVYDSMFAEAFEQDESTATQHPQDSAAETMMKTEQMTQQKSYNNLSPESMHRSNTSETNLTWETKPHHCESSTEYLEAAPKQLSRRTRRGSSTLLSPVSASEAGREKNRIAASKCRRKKRIEEKQLEEQKQKLESQHAFLTNAVVSLQSEVFMLKHEVLTHGRCDFQPIQSYIERMASQAASQQQGSTTKRSAG